MKEYSNDVRYEAPELRVVGVVGGRVIVASPLIGETTDDGYYYGGDLGSWADMSGALGGDMFSSGAFGEWDGGMSGALGGEAFSGGVSGEWADVSGALGGEAFSNVSSGLWADVSSGSGAEGYTKTTSGSWD